MVNFTEIATLFKEHDGVRYRENGGDLERGGFGHISPNVLLQWEGKKELSFYPAVKPVVAAQVLKVEQVKKVHDFAETHVANILPGDVHIKRIAFQIGHGNPSRNIASFAMLISNRTSGEYVLWLEEYIEYEQRILDAGFKRLCTKIRADSTMVGVYYIGDISNRQVAETKVADQLTLEPLDLKVPENLILPVVTAMKREGLVWADHYSSYNVAHTWKAVTLRGYGGVGDFIVKPSEMSKGWKAENMDKLNWTIQDTPLRAKFPECEPLIDMVPGKKHRVRLMKLAAGAGLLRHADITDEDAGTADGKLLRIHIPIVTNPETFVDQWELNGRIKSCNLKVGEVWYLDTRKPHAVRNGGKTDRVHLVMDVESSPELRRLLGVKEDQKAKLEAWI